ncbi:ATP-binding protein [Lichenifustis flavocetrariae]|uniref:histidine kinase n=1 Tax=Lichenifustis flavocetrariae TaxID=2949735 RepID=A0AA41Z052_9HYPH|nr:ATP-binding protein [Lichenifustis flavocetrariae]MCW6511774.1 PAS domain-containing protein [Lichenifustis flavocetrariae]
MLSQPIQPEPEVERRSGADIFLAAMNTSGIATVLTDPHRPDHPIVFANEAFSKLTGFASDEIIGRNCRFLQAPETDPAAIRTLREALATRRPISIEILNRKRDGTLFWNALCLGPVFDADGELRHFVGNQVDVSQRRTAEQALHQLQKMEAIGQLTGGVAHDFNNLLTVIMGSVEALRRKSLSQESRSRYIDAIGTTADRAARLTGQLLAFARKQPVEPTVFDAAVQVRRTADMLQTIVGSQIEITTELTSDRCFVRGDISQFETALVNLAVNGRDAMNGQGHLTISVRQMSDVPEWGGHVAVSRDVIAVAVSDTGTGIPSGQLDQIFQPLYTTKAVGAGTGLGLSQVQGFVTQMGGEVRVESEVDRGTTFTLFLPYAQAEPMATMARIQARPTGQRRLLMVEHHVQIAEITSEILEDLGYEVRSVTNAAAALAAIEGSERDFDLVFSDVLMPGHMNGVDLAHELNRRWPGLPVLLTTGYSNVLARQEELSGDFRILRKPYSAEALTSLIGDMIRIGPTVAESAV